MEVAPFFVDFHQFWSIFTIFYRVSRFMHFCHDLHFVAIYELFPQFFFGQNSLLRNITRFLHVWLKLNSAGEEGSWFFVFTFVFVCILVPYILLTNVCRSTYVSCQLCVVLFPFHSTPVQPLPHHQTCASVLTAPSPSSQPTPAALSAIFLFLLFIVSTFSTPPISLSCRTSLHRCLF